MERFDDGTQVSIREHAAEWFLRLHAHDLSAAERFAYLQWLKASPAHIGETLQICKLYSTLYPLRQQLFLTNEDDVSNVLELARDDVEPATRTRSSWHVRALLAAIAVGVLLLAGSIAKRTWFGPNVQMQANEWRSLALDDDSLCGCPTGRPAAGDVIRLQVVGEALETRPAVRPPSRTA